MAGSPCFWKVGCLRWSGEERCAAAAALWVCGLCGWLRFLRLVAAAVAPAHLMTTHLLSRLCRLLFWPVGTRLRTLLHYLHRCGPRPMCSAMIWWNSSFILSLYHFNFSYEFYTKKTHEIFSAVSKIIILKSAWTLHISRERPWFGRASFTWIANAQIICKPAVNASDHSFKQYRGQQSYIFIHQTELLWRFMRLGLVA